MNKSINISNYEEFLIDFLDGTLDETTHAQVLIFLENNPDIAEEFNGIEDVVVDECIGRINFKDELRVKLEPKILVNTENYEHYFIAYHQGDLSNDEIIQIDDFLSDNPQLQKDFDLFKAVSSLKSQEIVFEEKDSLKLVEYAAGEFILKSEFENICIDYFEGNLAPDATDTLLDAIDNNKELEGVFNLYHNIKYKADKSIVFEEKDAVKVVEFDGEFILKSEFETICIDYFEGNLAIDTTNTLLDTIDNNKELESIFNLFHNIKFKADKSIVFEEKSKLYRRRIIAVVPAIQYINSIAAAVVLLLMFNVYNFNLDGLNIENNISNPKYIETPAKETPLVSDNTSDLISTTTVTEVAPLNEIVVAVRPINKAKTTAQDMSIAKGEIEYMEPKDMRAAFVSEEFIMEGPKTIRNVSAAKDTSYFEITAPELADSPSLDSEVSPEEVYGQTGPAKFKKKVTRIFNREKEYYANREPKQALKKITNFAVKSYNLMTEGEETIVKK